MRKTLDIGTSGRQSCLIFYCLIMVSLLVSAAVAPEAQAHPEDEFCVPGEDSLDPALCAALSELDSPTGKKLSEEPIMDDAGNVRGFGSTVALYITIGVRHILPDGLDHILFVLALFLSSTRLRALVIQISTFTVAHTATLGLAVAGVISPSTGIIEPLIAATIAFVAIENLFLPDMPKWRPLVVFMFGLIHGLGFAGFFGELGLPPGQFWSALIGFNVGVEVGQLSVIAVAFAISWSFRRWLAAHHKDALYRRFVVMPGSALIGVIGLWWFAERVLTQLA
jgi:hypothetical protein